MVAQRIPLIAGNWKMNFDHIEAISFIQKLSWALSDNIHDYKNVEVAVFPPHTDLRSVQTIIDIDKIKISYGAQDVSQYDSGAYTGEVSALFLKQLQTNYVIVGHSERRSYHGETNEVVGLKAAAAIKHGIVPLICVGETAEDRENSGPSAVPIQQLREALANINSDQEYAIAYEPVWAIGSGQAASASDAENLCKVLREEIAKIHGDDKALAVRILYGGSVNSSNIAEYMNQANIDGVLVGGASIKLEEFVKIVGYQSQIQVS